MGAQALRLLLENCPSVQKVNVNRNKIGNLGAWALYVGSTNSKVNPTFYL